MVQTNENKTEATDKRIHHFVSQFLLKNFSKSGKEINIYDHERNKFYASAIGKKFAIRDLNTLIGKDGKADYNSMEDLFNEEFEKKAAGSVRDILNFLKDRTQPFTLTLDDYNNIFRFAIVTHFRTPYLRDKVKHAMLVNHYGLWYIDQFLKNKSFEKDVLAEKKILFDLEKGFMYRYLLDFDKMIKEAISDLRLTIMCHNYEDEYFLIPDQGSIVFALMMGHFAAGDLKIYLPMSSKVMFCYERIERTPGTYFMDLTREQVRHQNRFVLQRFYDFIGCEDMDYFKSFVNENKQLIRPEKKFNPYKMQENIEKIKKEILAKLGDDKFGTNIQTHINEDNEFRIVST